MIFSCKSLPLLSSSVGVFLGPKHPSDSGAVGALGKGRAVSGVGKAVREERAALGGEKMDRSPRFSKSKSLWQEMTVRT